MGDSPPSPVVVVAAVMQRNDKFLLTLRPAGTHLEGRWEFPGGKCLPAESHAEALQRELHEELDILGHIGACLHSVTHSYPDHTVRLYFYECQFDGEPKPMLGQQIAWVARAQLGDLAFPEADAQLIEMLAR